jgi:hypothetical protein
MSVPNAAGPTRALARATLQANTASASLAALGFDGLQRLCRQSAGRHAPDPQGALDPRGALPIAYSEVRATRLAESPDTCVVCESRTCPAADIAALPGGDVAWLTPNYYPIVFPFEAPPAAAADAPLALRGVHLVQWSSLRHDGGLVGADAATAAALFAQLARAEAFLLRGGGDEGLPHRGHVGIIKNRGRRVGGSVEHDHQQLLLSNRPFAEPALTAGLQHALLAGARAELAVDDIDGLARTLVPDFMRRPLHAFIVPRELPGAASGDAPGDARSDAKGDAAARGWLHQLPPAVRDAVAYAVARLTQAVSAAMLARGQEPAWNLVFHTGPGCGPLLELRPFTQPLGGYEHLGLYLCEERPATSAARLREALPR